MQPHRELLKKIRDNLGAHRVGIPWENARDGKFVSPNNWGEWEVFLISLEQECDLAKWINVFNGVHELLSFLRDFKLDSWYFMPKDGEIKFFMPLSPSIPSQ